jgi:hypothetical protein
MDWGWGWGWKRVRWTAEATQSSTSFVNDSPAGSDLVRTDSEAVAAIVAPHR